ncbi:rod shape-determining protein MreC [Moraxella oblonga]|uniref:rod shape-determining protein MreC n=1 Tax=Moraxella oblonga TaxID=200413 RepID=UPI00082BE1A1|nr:rod shape-determining protein MreC [Moraxella oblonga]
MLPSIFSKKPLFVRMTIGFLVVALILMLLDGKNPARFMFLRDMGHAMMQPVYQSSVGASHVMNYAESSVYSKESLRRENIRLQTELLQARAKLQVQDYILAQNARLNGILSTTSADRYDMTLARVIGTDSNPLKQMVVIDKGEKDGVFIGQTVIDEKGVLGQILNTSANTSRLVFITDEQQSVAVIVARTGQRAMVSGGGTPDSLSLDYIFKSADVQVGDELISSGLGDRFPAGYKVGTVSDIDTTRTDNFADIKVTPSASFLNSSYVLILRPKPTQEKPASKPTKSTKLTKQSTQS